MPATTQQLTATPRNAQGNILTGRSISWQSQNTAIATVNSSGLVTSVAPGSTVITATCGGVTANANVSVVATILDQFGISNLNAAQTLQQGQNLTIAMSLARSSGFTSSITITAGANAATGVTMLFGKTSGDVSSTSITITSAESNIFYVKLTATGSASIGTFALGVNGSGGGLVANTFVPLTISSSASPSISLTTLTNVATVARGGTVNIPVTLIRNGGFTGTVNLTAAGIPPTIGSVGGIPMIYQPTYSFSDASLSSGETTSTLSVTIPPQMTVGTHLLYIIGQGSGVSDAVVPPITFSIT